MSTSTIDRRPEPLAEREEPDRAHPYVICVDDEAPILAALTRLLRREPFRLVTTEDPFEALDWVRNHPVSLLITDQRMPSMAGTDLVRAVRAWSPDTPCIMLTGYPDTESVIGWSERSLDRLITKPWDNDALRSTIRDLLRHRDDFGRGLRERDWLREFYDPDPPGSGVD